MIHTSKIIIIETFSNFHNLWYKERFIIPRAISTNIHATTAKGRYCNALLKKNAEKIHVKRPTSNHDSLVVAHDEIFTVVLGTSALIGIHHTNHVIILVIQSPYTSRWALYATRVSFIAIFAEISVSRSAITQTHIPAMIIVLSVSLFANEVRYSDQGTHANNENTTSLYSCISRSKSIHWADVVHQIRTHKIVTITAPGTFGKYVLPTLIMSNVQAKIANASGLNSLRWEKASIGVYHKSTPRRAGICCIQMISQIPSKNHWSAEPGINVRYFVRRNTQKTKINSQDIIANKGRYWTPYARVMGRRIQASDPAGPYALCLLLQNSAASTHDRAHESNHIIGVAPPTIASDMAIGTLISATLIQDVIFACRSLNIRMINLINMWCVFPDAYMSTNVYAYILLHIKNKKGRTNRPF